MYVLTGQLCLCAVFCREFETLLHIVKATVGSGILNLPAAVKNAGVVVSLHCPKVE